MGGGNIIGRVDDVFAPIGKAVEAAGTPEKVAAYTVKDRGGQKAIWTRIGAAFPHGSGSGLTIQLDALPIGDRIVLTEPRVEAKAEDAQ